jgi:hypothetical protein
MGSSTICSPELTVFIVAPQDAEALLGPFGISELKPLPKTGLSVLIPLEIRTYDD